MNHATTTTKPRQRHKMPRVASKPPNGGDIDISTDPATQPSQTQAWAIAEQELRWYYHEAAGICGLRSTMGTFLDILETGILPNENSRKLTEAPDSLHEFLLDLDKNRRRLGAYGEARRIHQRLMAIGPHHARTLELAYGGTHMFGKVSLALAADCPLAVSSHKLAVKASHKTSTNSSKRRSKSVSTAPVTVRSWLLWLATHAEVFRGTSHKMLLDQIVEEATTKLHKALRVYCDCARVTSVNVA